MVSLEETPITKQLSYKKKKTYYKISPIFVKENMQ